MARAQSPGYFLFHVEHVVAAARYADIELNHAQLELMETYRSWLGDEAVQAGGIGPGEIDRIERRHLADSLLFASHLPEPTVEVWDVGSGVGLPGIPLAIALPDTWFTLIDRSGRRTRLAQRAIRVLGLENCQATQGEIENLTGEVGVIVSRASLPPDEMRPVAERLLGPGGVAILAGSWRVAPVHPGWETAEIPADVLDQPVWLLIMRRE